MERRESFFMMFWAGLEEVLKGLLAILFLSVLLFLVLFVHNWVGILLVLSILLGFVWITDREK